MLNIFTSFLALYDPADVLRPMLVTRIPTIDNGDWVLNPDGTMLTTYHLRENARWHDGEPVTAHDFVFAYQVYVDPELPVVVRDPETLMEGVDAVDPATLQIRWKQPYFRANGLSVQSMVPLPAHLLEEKYRSARAGFADLPEFTTAWIGAGPYRLEHWEPGVSVLGRANLDWFLGPPKIETLEIRFITDPNTILANLLSGDADYTGSPFVRVPQATAARDQLAAGVLHAWSIKIQRLDFQYREVPNWQRAVSDLRVRRALMHGLDRAGLADLMTGGLDGPADAYIQRSDPFFPDVDAAVTRYPYDPARATALFEEAGWHRSAASGLLANAAGQSFGLELWASQQQEAAFVVDSWKKVGIDASIFMKPSTGLSAETRASFPTIDISNGPGSPEWFVFTSAHFPTAANRWSGQNHGSFHDDEVDRLQQLRLSAVDANARREAAVALYQRVSELVAVGVLYYMPEFFIAHRRLTGPVGSNTINPATFWNIYEWDLTD
jgi:peptide/nickel transport system substrate-binding protein